MKKILSLFILSLFMLVPVTFARTTYNSDNTINVSNTIRGQKKVREQNRLERKKKIQQAAAAAKVDYEISRTSKN